MTIQNNDKFLVIRSDVTYQVTKENLMTKLQDDDLLIVSRDNTYYKLAAVDFKDALVTIPVGDIDTPVQITDPADEAGFSENLNIADVTLKTANGGTALFTGSDCKLIERRWIVESSDTNSNFTPVTGSPFSEVIDPAINAGSSTPLPDYIPFGIFPGSEINGKYLEITCVYVYESSTPPEQGGTEKIISSKVSSPITILIAPELPRAKGFRTSGELEIDASYGEITWFMIFGENGTNPGGGGSLGRPGGLGGSSQYAYVTMPTQYVLNNYPGSVSNSVEATVSLNADVFNDSNYPATTGTVSGGTGGSMGNSSPGSPGERYPSSVVDYFAEKFPVFTVSAGTSGNGGGAGCTGTEIPWCGSGGGGGAGGLLVEVNEDSSTYVEAEIPDRPPTQQAGQGGAGRGGRGGGGGGGVMNNPTQDNTRQIGAGGGGGGGAAEKDSNTSGSGNGGAGQGGYLFVSQTFPS